MKLAITLCIILLNLRVNFAQGFSDEFWEQLNKADSSIVEHYIEQNKQIINSGLLNIDVEIFYMYTSDMYYILQQREQRNSTKKKEYPKGTWRIRLGLNYNQFVNSDIILRHNELLEEYLNKYPEGKFIPNILNRLVLNLDCNNADDIKKYSLWMTKSHVRSAKLTGYYYLGLLSYKETKYNNAITFFKKLISKDNREVETNVKANMLISMSKLQLGDFNESKKILASLLNPDRSDNYQDIIKIWLSVYNEMMESPELIPNFVVVGGELLN